MPFPSLDVLPATRPCRTLPPRARAPDESDRATQSIRVRHIGNGIISGRVSGSREVFKAIGLEGIFTPEDPPERCRELAWLAFPRACYALDVYAPEVGGLVVPDTLERPALCPPGAGRDVAVGYINGGFFNHKGLADPSAPECSTMGAAFTKGRQLPGLPVPGAYQADYHPLQADGAASLMVAPRLSVAGQAVFTEAEEQQPRYQPPAGKRADGSPDIQPGSLQHAAMRNPRAAVSYPPTDSTGTLRLIVGRVADRERDPASGYTLGEWSAACARLDRLGVGEAYRSPAGDGPEQRLPNSSSNLDGGNSVAMGALVPGRVPLRISQSAGGRPVPNLIVVTGRTGR